jgi:HAD superfamily hydrolase (TIGR01509 family)
MTMRKAAIFDMDNVLFPTEALKFRAYQRVFAERYGIHLEDTPERVGLSERAAMTFFLDRAGLIHDCERIPELIREKRNAYYAILEHEDLAPYPGVQGLLEDLRSDGWRTGLATVSDRRSTDSLLDRFLFRPLFDSVVTVESVSRPKPDPEIYLLSADRLGAAPQHSVAIEDSPTGLEAAIRAGMKTLAVTHSAPAERLSAADLVVAGFDGIDAARFDALLHGAAGQPVNDRMNLHGK